MGVMENNQVVTTSKITYVIEKDGSLGLVSPYLFAQRLKDLIEVEIVDSKVIMNCLEQQGVIFLECNLPLTFPIADKPNIRKKIQSLAEGLSQKLKKQTDLIKACYQKSYRCFNAQ